MDDDFGVPMHSDYPHEPGTMYDCIVCESECCCSGVVGEEACLFCHEMTVGVMSLYAGATSASIV